jgi:hypothetical protein
LWRIKRSITGAVNRTSEYFDNRIERILDGSNDNDNDTDHTDDRDRMTDRDRDRDSRMEQPLLPGREQARGGRWSFRSYTPSKLPAWIVGSVITILVTVLLIVSISTTDIYRNEVISAEIRIGATDLCYHTAQPVELAGCRTIDRNCHIDISKDMPQLKAEGG